jgi:hypothetical protein
MTVKINGKDYPVLARYSAIKMFCDKKGIDLFEWPELLDKWGVGKEDFKPTTQFVDDMALLMMCFLERGAENAGTVCDLKLNDIIDWFMEGNMVKVYESILEAQGVKKNMKPVPTKKEH